MAKLIDHVHYELNRDVTAIGGRYAFLREGLLTYGGETVLYYIGCAVMDSSCCGAAGVCFARVPGYVRDLRYKTDAAGAPVSRLEPITDPFSQKEIGKMIQTKECVHQVTF